jgi:hypothetical protein
MARQFVEDFARPDSDEGSRTGAVLAFGQMVPMLSAETLNDVMATLMAVARGEYIPSHFVHFFTEVKVDESGRELYPTGRLPSAALIAAATVASATDADTDELHALAYEAARSEHGVMRARGLAVFAELGSLPLPPDATRYLTDVDATVRSSAIQLLVRRDPETLSSPAMVAMAADRDLSVRATLLTSARKHASGTAALAILAADEHCLLRRMAVMGC